MKENWLIKRKTYTVFLIVLLMILSACSSQQSGGNNGSNSNNAGTTKEKENKETTGEVIKWDYYHFMGTSNVMTQYAMDFAQKVKEKTKGKLEITVRPAGELPYAVTEVPEIVGKGNVQMGDAYVGYLSGVLKVAPISTLPYLIQNFDESRKVLPIIEPFVEKEVNKFGATILYNYMWPPQRIWGKGDPIKTLDDFKGKKTRVVGAEWAEVVKLLGGVPITVTPQEVPSAMERGVMDDFHTAATTVATNGWGDFADWVYNANIAVGGFSHVLVNQKALDALPADVRKVLEEVAKEYQEKMLSELLNIDNENFSKLVKSGTKVIEPAKNDNQDAIKIVSPYWDKWAEKNGPDAQEAMKLVREKLGR